MTKMIKRLCALVWVGSLTALPLRAMDIFQANEHFQVGQYEQALNDYQQLAELGNAQAFYQLGLMHYQGLGTEADRFKALMWFSLAAEQQFSDAQQVSADILALATEEQGPAIEQVLTAIKARYGMAVVQQKYFPTLKSVPDGYKIEFVDPDGSAASVDFHDKYDINISEALVTTGLSQESASIDYLLLGRPNAVTAQDRNYFAVVDYEIGRDGSVRNPQPLQVNGYIKPALSLLITKRFAQPKFDDQAVSFFQRSYLGMSGYNRAFIRTEQFERFYNGLNRRVKKLKSSSTIDDQYQYAVALMTFPWLTADKHELQGVLARLSTAGHPLAQYELGSLLYREQQDISAAVHWLNEASKAGVTKARYRLGRLLLDSPYVERDEHKALFWFKQAAADTYTPALLGAAEITLLATEPSLQNAEQAGDFLAQVPENEQRNPDYEFLQAMRFYSQPSRDLAKAVDHLRDAISLANTFNWDVTDWEKRLSAWTSNGKVLVTDVDKPAND
ncbi:tetratricopeptide repeat protein [Paraglaciecola sp.]|uniref:tetratricopeptide repeat protein n=1 Tax=Paraglaciecola sp. TaxID=1920173 RepID=UPI00273D8169|nr:hypothetical protein [Paraglaciecola sp.]MDP5030683.1 hypothetical protein [Paraglaciecola sp.]